MKLFLILIYVFVQISYTVTQVTAPPAAAAATGSIPILIKDDGVKALHKEDVAMIFLTNTDVNDPIQLSASSKKCCFKVEKDEEDCESMKLVGGDMGKLVPTDIRNLTLIYANLYLHDRVGSCEIEIKSMKGGSQESRDQIRHFAHSLWHCPDSQAHGKHSAVQLRRCRIKRVYNVVAHIIFGIRCLYLESRLQEQFAAMVPVNQPFNQDRSNFIELRTLQ
ncbi:uncharacterized protein CEXT_581771 [Caerostris extrusa]|uniref:Uncharacterized protein n=1 Tax=Caerostris extrusa TaxID=172846 RepID=A0AAV4R6P1_CAEEX|nr:uncharacterized protein CEXT_581771 [Caerostris extrusa]